MLDESMLVDNIYRYDLIDIIKIYPNLSAEFVRNYILNPDFQLTEKEQKIDIELVLKYQSHLLYSDLCLKEKSGPLFDFEKYMN
jgi:hypothetical protein